MLPLALPQGRCMHFPTLWRGDRLLDYGVRTSSSFGFSPLFLTITSSFLCYFIKDGSQVVGPVPVVIVMLMYILYPLSGLQRQDAKETPFQKQIGHRLPV